jgi:hypothetical protein
MWQQYSLDSDPSVLLLISSFKRAVLAHMGSLLPDTGKPETFPVNNRLQASPANLLS